MNLFGILPQERAMATLIHDHSNAICLVESYILLIQKEIGDGNVDLQQISDFLNKATNGIRKSNKVIDAYYDKFKNDFICE